jgi:hypothetical protein
LKFIVREYRTIVSWADVEVDANSKEEAIDIAINEEFVDLCEEDYSEEVTDFEYEVQ